MAHVQPCPSCVPSPGDDCSPSTSAAGNGHLKCLKASVERSGHASKNTVSAAAESGSVRCLTYLREEFGSGLFTNQTFWAAACYGHVRAVKWLCETFGSPYKKDINICYLAARSGDTDCLSYLIQHGYYIGAKTIASAAGSGHVHCVQLLLEAGCEYNREASSNAARGGKYACLVYSIQQGMPWWIHPVHVKDVRCLLFMERNAPSKVEDMIASSCHPTYNQIVFQRTVLLMCLKVWGLPADVMRQVAVQAGLYCDLEVENDRVSDSTSCSTVDMNDITPC